MKGRVAAGAAVTMAVLSIGLVSRSYLNGQSHAALAPVQEPVSYRHVVKKVLPAVVAIEAKVKGTEEVKEGKPGRRRLPLEEMQVPEEFRKFFDGLGQAPNGQEFHMPQVPQMGYGSGFIVDPKGVILTNHHVVDGASQVTVVLQDGRKFNSKEVKVDPKTDLAIVRIEAKEPLPALELGNSDEAEIGDRVLAVGAPFGLRGSVTTGIISSKGRSLRMNMYEDFLQTDAAINPGNSGGPLVSLDGKVVGINSAIKSRNGGFQGVGLAIASNLARNVMDQLVKDGVVHRGYLGVQIRDLDNPELAARLGADKDGGVLVTEVFDKMPGAKAGLKDGDVITVLGGKKVHNGHDLQMAVASLPLGKAVELSIVRDGKPQMLKVVIEEQPEDYGTTAQSLPKLPRRTPGATRLETVGLEVADLTSEAASRLGFPATLSGALVVGVKDNSLADEAGLEKGLVITGVDNHPVKSAAELKDAVTKGSLQNGLLLQVRSAQGGTSYALLKSSATK